MCSSNTLRAPPRPFPGGLLCHPFPQHHYLHLLDPPLLPRLWHPSATVPWEGTTGCITPGKGSVSRGTSDPGGPACLLSPSPFKHVNSQHGRELGSGCRHTRPPPNLILHLALSQPGQPRASCGLPRALAPGAHPTPTAFGLCVNCSPPEYLWCGGREAATPFPSFPVIQQREQPPIPSPGRLAHSAR